MLILLALILCVGLAKNSMATSVLMYSGFVSNENAYSTTIGTGTWTSGTMLEWSIYFDEATGEYTFNHHWNNGGDKANDISHFILEVSGQFTTANILPGTTPGYEGPTTNSYDEDNPNLPEDIYGIRWEKLKGQDNSELGPKGLLRHDYFFAKDDIVGPAWKPGYTTHPRDVYLLKRKYISDGYDIDVPISKPNRKLDILRKPRSRVYRYDSYPLKRIYFSDIYDDAVPIPNSHATPEPGTLLLLSAGLLGLIALRYRKSKR